MTFQIAVRYCGRELERFRMRKGSTYVDLNVLVLEIEGMLPDINADDRDVSQEGILIGGGGDFENLGRGVDTLCKT